LVFSASQTECPNRGVSQTSARFSSEQLHIVPFLVIYQMLHRLVRRTYILQMHPRCHLFNAVPLARQLKCWSVLDHIVKNLIEHQELSSEELRDVNNSGPTDLPTP
jgi:hypothetical protein